MSKPTSAENTAPTIGDKVAAPVTDMNGEESFAVGTLTEINSRWAYVELSDGTVIKVGKTKIEPVQVTEAEEREEEEDKPKRIAANYTYTSCRAASGRISCDNRDPVAENLRGMTLEQVYSIVHATIDVPLTDLKHKYMHLNNGQQRMCLGNRLRGWIKKNGGEL